MFGQRVQTNHIMGPEEIAAFDSLSYQMPWLYSPILAVIDNLIPPSASVHDVACGNGILLGKIQERHPDVALSGSDISGEFLELARGHYPTIEFTQADVTTFSNRGDVITCNLALHHFEDPVAALRHMYNQANKFVVVSDQVRPADPAERMRRLCWREHWLRERDIHDIYYGQHEDDSIGEAYNAFELVKILDETGYPWQIGFLDSDYYQRLVAVVNTRMEYDLP